MNTKTILVVEDERDIVDLIAYHLKQSGPKLSHLLV